MSANSNTAEAALAQILDDVRSMNPGRLAEASANLEALRQQWAVTVTAEDAASLGPQLEMLHASLSHAAKWYGDLAEASAIEAPLYSPAGPVDENQAGDLHLEG